MPTIRFAWNPLLVDLRREVCPGARWQKQGRCWMMSDAEAQRFMRVAQARLDFQRSRAQLRIDDITWVSDLPGAHRILWRPRPSRTRTPVWLRRFSSGAPGRRALLAVAARHHCGAEGTT